MVYSVRCKGSLCEIYSEGALMFIFRNSKGSLCDIAVIVFPARFFSVIPSGFTFFSQWIYTVILSGFTVDFSY